MNISLKTDLNYQQNKRDRHNNNSISEAAAVALLKFKEF